MRRWASPKAAGRGGMPTGHEPSGDGPADVPARANPSTASRHCCALTSCLTSFDALCHHQDYCCMILDNEVLISSTGGCTKSAEFDHGLYCRWPRPRSRRYVEPFNDRPITQIVFKRARNKKGVG